ncbi:MAG: PhoX family phosphatase [Ardenticatenales bacterium]
MQPSAGREGTVQAPTFEHVAARRFSRRAVLAAGAGAVTAGAIGVWPRAALGQEVSAATPPAAPAAPAVTAMPLLTELADDVAVADGHVVDVVVRWGDALFADAPAFDPAAQTAAAQARQFGYNCDYVAFLPHEGSADRGVLVVNHEYVNPEIMFPANASGAPTDEQLRIEMQAHGASVVEIARGGDGRWTVVRDSTLNRRLTAETPMAITGPAAGDPRLRTGDDPDGRTVRGTLNNCAGGTTPWGTILSSEENFQKYFAHLAASDDGSAGPDARVHKRYGMLAESDFGWERIDPRFDAEREPHEAFRFGWIVEFDPFDPESVPRKRTALGRFRHEGAATTVAKGGQLVLYSGDDDRFEYVYKFVTRRPYVSGGAAANADLLDDGTLLAARFQPDGTGEWLALEHGAPGLTAADGFTTQADVVIDARSAADALGATKMDRPEDIEVSPTTGRVYLALTNNNNRGLEGFPPSDPANPRKANKFGHVIELTEDDGDHAGRRFHWEILLLCGDPADPETYFAGFDKSHVSAIASPDNLTFDAAGNLWIATDGQPDTLGIRDGLYVVPTDGPRRGAVRQFLSSVPGSEVTGPCFSPDGTALFVAIQHPGEGGTFEAPASRWPDGDGPPRPSVIAVRRIGGGRVGPQGAAASMAATASTAGPDMASPATGSAGAATAAPGAAATATAPGDEPRPGSESQERPRSGVIGVRVVLAGAVAALVAALARRRARARPGDGEADRSD